MFENDREEIPMRDLIEVFRYCDPAGTGRIRIRDLQKLAEAYVGEKNQEINAIFQQLDARNVGSITFQEFYTGIRTAIKRKSLQQKICCCNESMMSPITVATESTLGNGGAGPEPRFVLSPPESPRPAEPSKSQCSSLSDGESFECYGEGGDIDADSGIASDKNTAGESIRARSPLNNSINRHTWLRTSLRRSPPSHQENLPNRRWGSFRHTGKRQLGSNALASQLYRSSSFNSSGRSSTCDTADDMYSDASLEEDVLELNHKMQLLQQQVGVLQDTSTLNDERYTRVKADNAALQARVIMLEEQLRDTEMRYEERLQDEQRRAKEAVSRLEREKELQLENSRIRLHGAEVEGNNLKEEVERQRIRVEKLENERRELSNQLQDVRNEIISSKEQEHVFKDQERRLMKDHDTQAQLIDELSKEVERLRSEARTPALPTTSPEILRLEELHKEMTALRTKNSQLAEANEELQASLLHAGVEQGRLLTAGENSLAAELEAMTHDERDVSQDPDSLVKIQQALKEQQEVNSQLRCYIDGILLNIVENYPQLLEVKHRSA